MNFRRNILPFGKSEDGSILVMVGVSLAVFIGFIALSFDLGRVAVTQTELQSYADHVALAAAGELDGGNDSITRAEAAAATFITDRQTFGDGGAALSGAGEYSLRFLQSLPALDTDPIIAIHETSDPRLAQYVEVTINSRNVQMAFGAAVLALTGSSAADADVAATAVAGYTLFACDITPMMFCIPDVANWKADDNIGQMILLRGAGGNSLWGPGNFGFLDLPNGFVDPAGPCAAFPENSANRTRCQLGAISNISRCIPQRGVSSDPGQSVGINKDAMNFRFDMYPNGGPLNAKDNADYAAAPNVLKNREPQPNGCIRDNSPESNALTLPRDPAVNSDNRFGAPGNWEGATRTDYYTTNYPESEAAVPDADGRETTDPDWVPTFVPADPFPDADTRYEYYLAEIAADKTAPEFNNSILRPVGAGNTMNESALPSCSNKVTTADRRVLIAAGVDCTANEIQGRAENIPVKEFVKLFMTEPVGSGSNFDIWTEVVGTAEAAANGQIRRVVELVR